MPSIRVKTRCNLKQKRFKPSCSKVPQPISGKLDKDLGHPSHHWPQVDSVPYSDTSTTSPIASPLITQFCGSGAVSHSRPTLKSHHFQSSNVSFLDVILSPQKTPKVTISPLFFLQQCPRVFRFLSCRKSLPSLMRPCCIWVTWRGLADGRMGNQRTQWINLCWFQIVFLGPKRPRGMAHVWDIFPCCYL